MRLTRQAWEASREERSRTPPQVRSGFDGTGGLTSSYPYLAIFDFIVRPYKNMSIPSNNSQLSSVWPRSLRSAWLWIVQHRGSCTLSLSMPHRAGTSVPLLPVSTPNPPLWVHSSPSTRKVGNSPGRAAFQPPAWYALEVRWNHLG